MKKILFAVMVFLSLSSYGQEVFEYEFDENIALHVLDDTEEGEMPNGKYIRGSFENEVFTCSNSNKAKSLLATIDDAGLLKLFQGVKDGNLKATKGKLVSEEVITLKNTKVSKFKISFALESKNKIIESYVFAYKNLIYTLQFMNNASEFDKLNDFRKSILDSIVFK